MKFTSLYKLSEKDKEEILRKILPDKPPEEVMTVNKEMWQEFMDYADAQEAKINDLKRRVDYLVQMSQYQYKQYESLRKEVVHKIENTADDLRNQLFRIVDDGEKKEEEIAESWEEIIGSIADGTYREKYKIGNYKPLDLGKEGIIRMQIAGFDTEPLADGSGKAAITWIAMDLLKTEHCMNPKYETGKNGTGAIGGWKESEMRKYLEETVKYLIPRNIKNSIKQVVKYSCGMDKKLKWVYNEKTEDYLWIPSAREIFGSMYDEEKSAVYYHSLYNGHDSRVKSAAWWWLRSAYDYIGFNSVYSDGSNCDSYAGGTGGVVLGFCT